MALRVQDKKASASLPSCCYRGLSKCDLLPKKVADRFVLLIMETARTDSSTWRYISAPSYEPMHESLFLRDPICAQAKPRVCSRVIFTVTAGWSPWLGLCGNFIHPETWWLGRCAVNSQLLNHCCHFIIFQQTQPPAQQYCRSLLIIWLI